MKIANFYVEPLVRLSFFHIEGSTSNAVDQHHLAKVLKSHPFPGMISAVVYCASFEPSVCEKFWVPPIPGLRENRVVYLDLGRRSVANRNGGSQNEGVLSDAEEIAVDGILREKSRFEFCQADARMDAVPDHYFELNASEAAVANALEDSDSHCRAGKDTFECKITAGDVRGLQSLLEAAKSWKNVGAHLRSEMCR